MLIVSRFVLLRLTKRNDFVQLHTAMVVQSKMGYLGTLFLVVQFIVVVNCVLFLPKDKVLHGSSRLDKTLTDKLLIPSSFREKLVKHHQSLSRRNEPVYHTLERRDATSKCGLESRSLEVDIVSISDILILKKLFKGMPCMLYHRY